MRKLLLLLLFPYHLLAQNNAFAPFKDYPFTTGICASAQGSKIAWAMDEQGKRNVYVAEGTDFKPRALTHFLKDDGQEITSLSITADGKWVVFVRGGDHGANWDIGLSINPLGDLNPFKVQVACIPFAGGEVKYLSEGDYPAIAPNNTVAFIKSGQVWTAHPDSAVAKSLFTTRGSVSSLQWSPDGNSLLFVSNRTGHSIIGIYSNHASSLTWVAPTFSFDGYPQWSPDRNKIVFVRRPVTGGKPDSLLARKHDPWSIYVADIASNKASLLWKAPTTLRGSAPTTDGGANLHWAAGNNIVFLSYQDGWPHLYSVNAGGGAAILLTPGNFMCEHITLSFDKKTLVFSANAGTD